MLCQPVLHRSLRAIRGGHYDWLGDTTIRGTLRLAVWTPKHYEDNVKQKVHRVAAATFKPKKHPLSGNGRDPDPSLSARMHVLRYELYVAAAALWYRRVVLQETTSSVTSFGSVRATRHFQHLPTSPCTATKSIAGRFSMRNSLLLSNWRNCERQITASRGRVRVNRRAMDKNCPRKFS